MTEERWRSWGEIEVDAKAAGRLDEDRVAAHQKRMRAEQRAYRLAEIRKKRGLTQEDLAAAMRVSQRRVSAVEHGDLSRARVSTVAGYVAALGGTVEIVARIGGKRIVIGSGSTGTGDAVARPVTRNQPQPESRGRARTGVGQAGIQSRGARTTPARGGLAPEAQRPQPGGSSAPS